MLYLQLLPCVPTYCGLYFQMFLLPEAKYELQPGDQLMFADICCVYLREGAGNTSKVWEIEMFTDLAHKNNEVNRVHD